MTNQQQEKNIEDEAKALGKKIVLLLKSSDLPEDVQISIINMLPEFTLEQIDELVDILTDNVARGGAMNKELELKLGAVKQKYDAKKSDLSKSIMDELDDIEREINE